MRGLLSPFQASGFVIAAFPEFRQPAAPLSLQPPPTPGLFMATEDDSDSNSKRLQAAQNLTEAA